MIDDCKYDGIVIALRANYLEVEIDIIDNNSSKKKSLNNDTFKVLCTRRSRLLRHQIFVNVGDKVSVEAIDWKLARAVICNVYPRQSLLIKPPVANPSLVIIALSLRDPSLTIDQASRFLITAEQSNIDLCLLLTKSDLLNPIELDQQVNRIRSWGYKPIPISTKTGYGLEALLQKISETSLAVIAGPSGVGKTSLLKTLLPDLDLRIGALSKRLKRGKNTTRNVELHSLVTGSRLADTPGFNRPEINLDNNDLSMYFPEIRKQLLDYPCKFRNCLHLDELGCGIKKDFERYSFYRKLLNEKIIHHRSSQVS